VKKHKPVLHWVLLILAVLITTPAHGLDALRIGLSALSPTNWPVLVADEKGFFKNYGIDPQVIYIGGGSARGVSALIAKQVQFMVIGGVGVIGAALRGVDVVMVASNVNRSTQRLISRPEIKTPKDLQGKRVGVVSFGGNTYSVLLMLLKKWSMKPEEFVILQVGPSPTMLISLEKGGIDAAVLTAPSDFIAEQKGNQVLADLADMQIFSLQSTITTTREFLKSREDQATRFLKAYAEGIAYVKKNKAASIDLLRRKLRMEPEQESYLGRTHQLYASKYLDRVPYVSLEGVKTLLESLEGQDPKAKAADPGAFVDSRIVTALENSGFFTKLYE